MNPLPDGLGNAERTALADVLTWDLPLGPANAQDLSRDRVAASLLFQRENTIYTELLERRGIIIGRRGSGKTAVMNQLYDSKRHGYVVFFRAYDLFPEILDGIDNMFRNSVPPVEVVARLWNILIWCAIFVEIARHHQESDANLRSIVDFNRWMNVSQDDPPEGVAQHVIEHLIAQANSTDRALHTTLRLEQALGAGTSTSFAAAQDAALNILKSDARGAAPVLILMDTLEKYPLSLTSLSYSISGLLHFLGRSGQDRGVMDVRFCLPAELYLDFLDLSSNPMKDFAGQTTLNWHAGDLMLLIAHRLALYLWLYEPKRLEINLKKFDISRRSGAVGFCNVLLPPLVQSLLGSDEPVLAYMLRHTQLLPRHLIDIFNGTLRRAVDRRNGTVGPISATSVVQAVQDCEIRITTGIVQAYEHKYPYLRQACSETLPNLPRQFSDGMLHKAFNRHARSIVRGEYRDFKRMLTEAGVIGKSIGKITGKYHEAEFEYTAQGKFVLASDDLLCLHPLFSGVFPAASSIHRDENPIFPRGSNPE